MAGADGMELPQRSCTTSASNLHLCSPSSSAMAAGRKARRAAGGRAKLIQVKQREVFIECRSETICALLEERVGDMAWRCTPEGAAVAARRRAGGCWRWARSLPLLLSNHLLVGLAAAAPRLVASCKHGERPRSAQRPGGTATHAPMPKQLPVCNQAAAASNAAARLTAAAAPAAASNAAARLTAAAAPAAAACRPSGVRAMLGGRLRTWGRVAATSTTGEQTSWGCCWRVEVGQDRAAGSAAAAQSCCLPAPQFASLSPLCCTPGTGRRRMRCRGAASGWQVRLGVPASSQLPLAARGACGCFGFPSNGCPHLLVAMHS